MSDQLERAWEQATENAETGGEGARRSELERAFNIAAGEGVRSDVMQDPSFSRLADIQSRINETSGASQSQLRNDMLEIVNELTAKYDVTRDQLSKWTASGRSPSEFGEVGAAEPERAAGGSATVEIDPLRVARGGLLAGTDALEPFFLPQQVYFRNLMEGFEQREEFMRQADAYRKGDREEPPDINPPVDIGVEEVDWEGAFTPGLQENFVTFGDVLMSAGVPEDHEFSVALFAPPGTQALSARMRGEEPPEEWTPMAERRFNTVRTVGLFGDLLVDPLLAGPMVGGMGRTARALGATRAGDDLMRAGREVTHGTSPMGARAAVKAIAPKAVEGTEARISGFLDTILNTPMGRHGGREMTAGEWVFPRGRRPGAAMGETERAPSAIEGAAGRPEELVTAERANQARMDDVLEAIDESAARIREAFGEERYKNWMGAVGGAIRNRFKAFRRADGMPTKVRDGVQTMAAEVIDNRGVLLNPEALSELHEVPLRRTPLGGDETIFGTESIVARTVGEELSPFAPIARESQAAQRANGVYDANRKRVMELAEREGVDVDRAVRAFDYIAKEGQKADAITGYHMSMYEPTKTKFFEQVAAAGGSAEDAAFMWDKAFHMALDGEDLGALAETYSQRTADPATPPFGVRTPEAQGEQAQRMDRLVQEWLSGRRPTLFNGEVRNTLRGNNEALRVLLGHTLSQTGTQQLNIGSAFNAWVSGHLRRAYASGNSTSSYRALARQIETGGVFTNRIIDSTMYGSKLEGRVRPQVQDLISDYVETVSPTVPAERGFIIRQDNLVRHLLDNGVSPMEAKAAMRAVGEAAQGTRGAGEALSEAGEASRTLRDVRSRQEGVAEQRLPGRTGTSFTEERLEGMELAPESRARRRERIIFSEGLGHRTEAGEARLRQLEAEEVEGRIDVDTMAALGRLFDPELSLREAGQAMRSQYPKSRFLFDVEKMARQSGKITRDKASAPESFMLLEGRGYGPLDGAYVHPWFKKEVDNVLRNPDGNQGLRAFNRIRSAVTSSWLTATPTVAMNHAGGTLAAMLQGANPVQHVGDVVEFYRQVGKNGMRGLDHFDEMGDLFQTGMAQDDLAKNLRTKQLTATGLSRETIVDFFSERLSKLYTNMNRKPIPGLGNFVGLDAFQLSENAHKWARYKSVLDDTGDPKSAYRAAREVTFDYPSLPGLLRVSNDTGLTPFVGFPYFMAGRVVSSALNRPGVLGAADRVANSVWNAAMPNEDVQYAVWRELEEWERDARYVPVRSREPQGTQSMFPIGQVLPTAPWQENPFGQSLMQGGVYSALFDLGYGLMNQGEAAFGARYGQRVTEATAEGGEKARQISSFLANNYAPAWLRNLAFPGTAGEPPHGAIPDVARLAKPLVGDGMGELATRMAELESGRLNQDWFETASSYLLRQTRPVSINPVFSRVLRERSGAQFEASEEMRALNEQLQEIARNQNLSEGQKTERMQQLVARMVGIEVSGAERMVDVLRGFQATQGKR